MTTVTVYRSTDSSAPSLTGQVGTLVTVLDAVLVNGYGSQSAAGWAKSFSGTNTAAYRNSAVDGTGYYLNVNDNAPTTAKEARMTGYATMSAIATGTGQFPTLAQLGVGIGSVVCRKSNTADSTARAWTIVADDTVFYLFIESGDITSPLAALTFVFGDIFSYKASDANRCIIIGRNAENTTALTGESFAALHTSASTTFFSNTMIGHYMAATWTGVGGSIIVSKHIDQTKMGGQAANPTLSGVGTLSNATIAIGRNITTTLFPYPNGPDGGLYVSPIWVHHSNALRGYLKGLWAPLHDRPLNHNDTYSGTGNLSGKSFLAQSIATPTSVSSTVDFGQVHIETSSTWS